MLEEKIGHYPEEERRTKMGVCWAGFWFSSYADLVIDDVAWLWETYEHEKTRGVPLYLWTVKCGYIEVPFNDFVSLNKGAKEMVKRVSQTSKFEY